MLSEILHFLSLSLPPSLPRSALKMYNYSGPLSHYMELFLEGKNQYGSFFAWESRYKVELGGDDRRDHVFHTSFEGA